MVANKTDNKSKRRNDPKKVDSLIGWIINFLLSFGAS